MSDRTQTWTEWIDGPIKRGVIMMYHHRQIWDGIAEIIREHGSLPDSAFWQYHVDVYASTQAVAVRRQATDLRRGVASLARLVDGVSRHSGSLTRDWWVDVVWSSDDEMDRAFARRQWVSEYASEADPDRFDAKSAAADLRDLQAAAAAVKSYVDKHVAHSAQPGAVHAEDVVTVNEIHDAIDVVGAKFRRYYSLFTAADWVELAPFIQHDWRAPFRVRWIDPSAPPQ